ncbi:rho guanine nucleotide exchange factor 10-like isoform X3 [Apostichopus japonicus]|uniref:rho guanine nucleotide exchange factor 10-like isoform X3 n=1 Tax=Stichopus japonicus TaxID=307972 RepID=UPI003AB85B53
MDDGKAASQQQFGDSNYVEPNSVLKSGSNHLIQDYEEPANNSNSNKDDNNEYLQVKDYYHLNTDEPEDSAIYETVEINRTENGSSSSGGEDFNAPKRENPFNRVANGDDTYEGKKGAKVTSLLKQLGGNPPVQLPPRLPGAVGTPFLGKSRVPPIGAEQSPTESDEARQRPTPTWPDGGPGETGERNDKTIWEQNVAYAGFQEDQGYTISPSHLASRFDALECNREDGATYYEDVQFDEGEHGFFIDDDLYDDILGMADDEYVAPEESDSSWGSDEWDTFSEDSDTDDQVHSYVDPNEPSSRGIVEHGGSSHSRSFVSAYGIDRSPSKEEPKSYMEWVKMLKDRSSSLDKVRSFLFGRSMQGRTGDNDENDEDKDDIQYIDVKLNNMKHPPPILPPQPDWLTSEEIGRRHVIQAIVDSERSYMMSLQKLIQNYEKPLLDSSPPILEREKVKAIFYRVRGIYQCHLMFQIALASRVKNWDEMQQIGDVFVASFSKAMVLDVYSSYVNNFTHAMETAKKSAAQKSRFHDFLEKHQSCSNDRLSLYALMLKPIQRFPQFICLLQDLLKRTPLNHPDRMPLQLALTKLETLAGVLNERKRQSEQRHAVKHLIRNINAKFSVKMGNDSQRWLVRQDDVLQTWFTHPWSQSAGVNIRLHTYDSHGEELKCKERRLILLNDLLVCTTPIANTNSSGLDAPRYKHRWSVPLSEVEILEPSSDGGDVLVSKDVGRMTITTQHMDENEYLYGGSTRQLYQERNDLMHDLAVVKQLGAMLSNLKGTYGVLTQGDIEEWALIIHKLIRKKGQEIKQADVSKIQLSLPSVHVNERVTVVFDTVSPKIKQDWLTALDTAKLGLKPQNNPGWYAPDESDSTLVEMNFGVPLHMKTLPIFSSQEEMGKIQTAVLIPPEKFSFSFRKRSYAGGEASRTSLWLCSSDDKNTEITIVGFQPISVQETFQLEERQVLCMEYVPNFNWDNVPLPENHGSREYVFKGPTVWMGCKSGRLCIYEVRQSDKSHYMATFQVPHPVLDLKYMNNNLFAALSNGSVLIYTRSYDGQWGIKDARLIELDSMAVTCLLPVQSNMWCGCGNNIFILEPESNFRVASFEAHQDPRQNVRQLVMAGIGVWVAFTASDTIRLFHLETLQVLQDISVSSPVNRMITSLKQTQSLLYVTQPVYVTTFLACHGSLWVGTNTGVIVNFPLPRLEGVPLVNGPAMVSYHAHYSPIRFLTSMEIHQQHDKILYSSTEDDAKSEVSSVFSERIPPSIKGKSADRVSSAMSPMTDYFSLTPHDTESKPLPGEMGVDEEVSSAHEAEEDEEEVFAKITSTTSLVISGGEGHSYLMSDSTDGKTKVANILMWQVSM